MESNTSTQIISADVKLEGTYSITVNSNDKANNGNSASFEFTIDRTNPVDYALRNANVDLTRFEDYKEVSETLDEYVFLCDYISGSFGTGEGPEFSNNPAYKDRGNYSPVLIAPENVKNIHLIPKEFKEQLIQDIGNNKF